MKTEPRYASFLSVRFLDNPEVIKIALHYARYIMAIEPESGPWRL